MNSPYPEKGPQSQALRARIARMENRLRVLKEDLSRLEGPSQPGRIYADLSESDARTGDSNSIPTWPGIGTDTPQQESMAGESFEAGLLGRFDWDPIRNVTRWSPELSRLYGIDPAEFNGDGERWKSWIVAEDLPRVLAAASTALSTGRFEEEWRIVRQDDQSVRWLAGRGKVLYDETGRAVRMVGINLDITDRKRAEAALHEIQDRLRVAAAAARFGAFDADLIMNTHYWSPELRAIVGYPLDAPAPAPSEAPTFVHPDDREEVEAAMGHALAKPDSGELFSEHRVVRPDGTLRWVQLRGSVRSEIIDGQRRPTGYSGFVLDVTESKLAAQAVRDAQAKLETALESMTDAVMICDARGEPVQFNEAFVTFHRFSSREECIATLRQGPGFLELSESPDDRPLPCDQWCVPRAMRGETATNAEFRMRRTDTGESWMASFSFAPIRDKDGAIYGAIIAGRDITSRKKVEEDLRLLTTRFEAALKNSGVVVFNQDLDLRYTWIYNPALGYLPSDVVGHRDVDMFERPEDSAVTEALKIEVIRTGESRRKEVLIHSRGIDRFYDLQVDPLRDAAGHITGVTCAAVDMTDRRQAEQALLRSEKLSTVGRYAASVAHEINNPLEAVTNLLYLMRIQIDDRSALESLLSMADDELKRVANTTRQALGFYREMASPQRTSVISSVEGAIEILRSKIKTRAAKVSTHFDDELVLEAVPGELRQVIANLLSNCIDAVDHGGTIRIAARTFAGDEVRPPAVRIMMADSGHGIDKRHLAHIFEPLFSTKSGTGAGLGLWVARQIIEKHGGAIRVRSRTEGPYRGTTFCVDLPVAVTQVENAPQALSAE